MATTHTGGALALAGSAGKGRASRRAARAPAEPPSLRELPLFANVTEATLARLSLEAKVEHFDDGETIFRQGDPSAAIVIVLQGYVKILRVASNGDETLISIRSNGQTVSELLTGAEDCCGFSAEAVGVASILKLPAARFARTIKESPELCAAVVQDAQRRLASLVAEIESLKGQNADQRLARFLVSLCPPNAEQCRFRLPYDKRLIASQLGVKQETLSRAFAKLREYGVRTETRNVVIESVSRLMQQCDRTGRPALDAEAARDDAA